MRFSTPALPAHTSFQVFTEMARPLDDHFEPGYEVWAFRNEHGRLDDDKGKKPVYILGIPEGGKVRGLYLRNQMTISGPKPIAEEGPKLNSALAKLRRQGYQRIRQGQIAQGKAAYAGAEIKPSGQTKPWKGIVYHGTSDYDFFNTVDGDTGFGLGSHLESLNDGDAFSVTPDFATASEFAGKGMVIEYQADIKKLYYASIDEDDLDEINLGDDVEAVAIPYGQYKEDEFAIVNWYSPTLIIEKAVHLLVDGKWKRYELGDKSAVYHGAWHSYLSQWMDDLYDSDISDMIEEYSDEAYDGNVADEDEGGYVYAGDPPFYFITWEDKPYFHWDGDRSEKEKHVQYGNGFNPKWPKYYNAYEFRDKHPKPGEELDEATLGVHPLGYVLAPEAEQDFKALMKTMPPGPRKLQHRTKSLFEGVISRTGKVLSKYDGVKEGQVRFDRTGSKLTLEVGAPLSASQKAKVRSMLADVTSVDLDIHSDSHKDFEHYKEDRKEQVLSAIASFFKYNRLPPFEELTPLRSDVDRMDQA